jgi:hypothetical protein
MRATIGQTSMNVCRDQQGMALNACGAKKKSLRGLYSRQALSQVFNLWSRYAPAIQTFWI